MKDFLSRYGLRILAISAAVAVLLSVLSFLSATSTVLRSALGTVTAPFHAAVTAVENWITDKQRYYADYTALEAENADLRRQLADAEEALRQAQSDREENALLRELLSLKAQRRDFAFCPADVIDRQSSNWNALLTLDRGTSDEVAVGDCVVSAEGYLVGVVCEAGLNWCSVRTVTDSEIELGARVFRTGELATASGDFTLMERQRLRLNYLSADAELLAGDYVVTSGLGGFYPSGLPIGTVESVRRDEGREPYAILVPFVSPDTLGEVFVITDYAIID